MATLGEDGLDPTIRRAEDIAERLGEVLGVAAVAAPRRPRAAVPWPAGPAGAACEAANRSNATR